MSNCEQIEERTQSIVRKAFGNWRASLHKCMLALSLVAVLS